MYTDEAGLVRAFVRRLRSKASPFGEVRHKREFYYVRGSTDVIAVTAEEEVLAFEAKLLKWRDALHQAHRNRCFAHRSYVVFPEKLISRALLNEREFARRRIGICAVSRRGLRVVREAQPEEPLELWLSRRASEEAR